MSIDAYIAKLLVLVSNKLPIQYLSLHILNYMIKVFLYYIYKIMLSFIILLKLIAIKN